MSAFGLRWRLCRIRRVGGAEDGLGAAVVPLQLDDLAAGEVVLEVEDVVQVRPAPAVDRLVGVAGDAEVRVVDRQGPDDRVLGEVRVLVLVDEDVAEPGVELRPDLGVLLAGRDEVDEQVVEIDRVDDSRSRFS